MFALLLLVAALPQRTAAATSPLRWAYYVANDARSYRSLAAHHRHLDAVSPDMWHIHPNGSITSHIHPDVIRNMRRWGLKVYPMVTKYVWSDKMRPFWANRTTRNRAATELARLMQGGDYAGIHLDIENVDQRDAEALRAFYADIAARVHGQGRQFTIALPAKSIGTPDWHPTYNYAKLASFSDLVVIMAYDHGYAGGPAGPVAPLPWVRNVLTYGLKYIPPSKLLLGVPWYGYDWGSNGKGRGRYISHGEALQRGATYRYDAAVHAPTASYRRADGLHIMWYENKASTAAKLSVVTANGVRGWAAWRLGYEDPAMWTLLAPRR